ncbi:MAG: glycosyltransferase family 2 protein [Bacteroidales bacterium]|jgi:GT2 family glycosyltransferase|nr:glycosyltransferase family 2 protein [Bacteroidales bacterium]
MPRIAVVILNWNGKTLLERFLPTLLATTDKNIADIVVADNSSTDGSQEYLRNHPQIRLIELDENYGFAGGYNRALSQITHEYAVLLNSDVETTPGWLEPMRDYLLQHAEVAACQPKILSWNNKTRFDYAGAAGGYIDKYGYPFCRGRIFSKVEKDHNQYDTPTNVFWTSGACLFIRMNDFYATGGFDECFFAHMEEIDLCWRLKLRGKRIVCLPQSIVYHVGASTLKVENPQKTYLNFRNNRLMLYKNMPKHLRKKTLFIRNILDFLAAIQFLATGKPANARAVLKANKDFNALKINYNELQYDKNKLISEIYPRCILIDYYLKGKKCFSNL